MNKPLSFIFERAHHWARQNARTGPPPPAAEESLEEASRKYKRLEVRFRPRQSVEAALRRVSVLAALVALPLACPADSLWKPETSRALIADKKAGAVGDILTIVVQESNSASKNNNTQTSKSSGVDASISSFLYPPTSYGALTKNGSMPALKYDSSSQHKGGGKINNSEEITARIAVRVVDVLPNKSLIVEGRKRTAFSGEKQEVILRGVVRSEDVTSANTVMSYNVADASIRFESDGTVSDAQKKGWLSRAWDKINPL
jgi:flagellar L-ring protein precursor FlgH